MSSEQTNLRDIDDDLREVLQQIAERVGMPEQSVADMLQRSYGLDATDVSADDATSFREAYENGNEDEMAMLLSEYGVDEQYIQQFKQQVEMQEGAESGKNTDGSHTDTEQNQISTNGNSPSDSQPDTPSRAEIQEMIEASTPTADEIAARLEQRMTSTGENTEGNGGDQQSQLAQLISIADMMGMGGSSGAAKLGEKFQEKAMESAMERTFAPDPFDIARQKWARKHADEIADSEEMKELMGGGFGLSEADDDDDDDDSSWWS